MSLVDELHGLNPWPAETLSGVEQSEAARRLLETVVVAPRPRRRSRRATTVRTIGRLPAIIAVPVVAAVMAVIFFVVLPTTPVATTPTRPSLWRLVAVNEEPFRSVPGPGEPGLQCVTDTVCYTPGSNEVGSDLYRTADGGRAWRATTPVPVPESGLSAAALRCTSANTCMVVGAAPSQGRGVAGQLAITNDGGITWRSSMIPGPSGLSDPSVGRIACGDDTHCVVSVRGRAVPSGTPAGTFITTANGGATWVQSALPVGAEAATIWDMTCGSTGACIALSVSASAPGAPGMIVALHSSDLGHTWTAGAPIPGHTGILLTSCGDDLHCLLIEVGTGRQYQVVRTSNGGLSWTVDGPQVGWGNLPTAVSCATGLDCWVAVSTYDRIYSDPVVEQTSDGGTTWVPLKLPVAHPAIADVLSLSCPPIGNGCMAIGNLADHFGPPPRSQRAMLSPPFIVSSLPEP